MEPLSPSPWRLATCTHYAYRCSENELAIQAGVHEHTGVCLQRHCGHNCTGGYTREYQNTAQCCDGQSFTRQVATGLPQRRCAVGWWTTVLIDLLVHHVAMAVLCERWGLSASCLYDWQRAFLLHGLESLRYRRIAAVVDRS